MSFLFLPAQVEAVRLEGLLDFLDRLLAEVRDRGELVLGLRDEVADRLDADALEAVVRADAELELLDREVLHPVCERLGRAGAVGRRRRSLAEALDLLDVREDRELADEDLRRLRDRLLGIDRAVGRDVEAQLVVVRPLPDARRFDVVRDAAYRREDRVDRDHTDRRLRAAREIRRRVAPAAADRERHLEAPAVCEVREHEVRIEDLEVGRRLDVARGDLAGAARRHANLDLRRLAVEHADHALEVEDDVRDVLANARDRRELVRDALDLHRGDCGALERREQHAAQRVSEGVTEAAVERLDHEDSALFVHFLVDDLRNLEVHQAGSGCQSDPFSLASLLAVELDDQRFLDGRVDLVPLGPLQDLSGQVVVVGLEPRRHGCGEVGRVADDRLGRRAGRDRDHVVRPHLVARDVHATAVHVEVPVPHELPGLRARSGEAEAVDDVVETRLEDPQQVLTGDAGTARRLLVIRAELLLEQAVVAARLLLLAQLLQVLALLDAATAVLARRVAATLDRALLGQAALALEEELHPLAAALLALRTAIAGHLDAPPLLRADAVVRLRRHVADAEDLEAGGLERANRRLPTRARALDEDLDLLQAVLHALPRAGVGGDLRGERRRLARALEARGAGRLPRDHVAVLVGQRHDRVVEGRLDVRLADRDVLADATARATSGRLTTGRRHLLRLLPAADGLLRALARTRVRLRALAVHRQPAPVAQAAVRADLGQPLDRLRALTAEVAFHLEVRVDVVAELRDFLVGQVLDLRVRRETELPERLLRSREADAVDVGQPDLEPLLIRKVHSGDTCQIRLLALALLVPWIRADDHRLAVPLDDAAPLTHRLDRGSYFHLSDTSSNCAKSARGMTAPTRTRHGSKLA